MRKLLILSALLLLTACGAAKDEDRSDWKDYTSYLSMEREEALEALEKEGLTLTPDEDEPPMTAGGDPRLYKSEETETLYDQTLTLTFAIEDQFVAYTKNYSGTQGSHEFTMRLFELLTEKYGAPMEPFDQMEYSNWDEFNAILLAAGGVDSDESGRLRNSVTFRWPEQRVRMQIYSYRDTEEIQLWVQYLSKERLGSE